MSSQRVINKRDSKFIDFRGKELILCRDTGSKRRDNRWPQFAILQPLAA